MDTAELINKTKEQIVILEKGVASSITPEPQKVIMRSTLDTLEIKLSELEKQLIEEQETAAALAEQKIIDDAAAAALAEEQRVAAEEEEKRLAEEKKNKKSPALLKLEKEFNDKLKQVAKN